MLEKVQEQEWKSVIIEKPKIEVEKKTRKKRNRIKKDVKNERKDHKGNFSVIRGTEFLFHHGKN